MTTTEPAPAGAPNLIERAKNMVLQPKAEWERISGETTGVQSLITGYALPLIALQAICGFIGMSFIGNGFFRMPLVWGATAAVVQVVMGVIVVFILGLIINALASTFGSTANQERAHRLAIYSMTAGWLAGIVTIIPALGILAILGGLYSLYVLFVGLGPMMATPEDKRVPYILTILVVWIVLAFVVAVVVGAVSMVAGTGAAMMGGAAAPGYGY